MTQAADPMSIFCMTAPLFEKQLCGPIYILQFRYTIFNARETNLSPCGKDMQPCHRNLGARSLAPKLWQTRLGGVGAGMCGRSITPPSRHANRPPRARLFLATARRREEGPSVSAQTDSTKMASSDIEADPAAI
jgi:hypothetical protein